MRFDSGEHEPRLCAPLYEMNESRITGLTTNGIYRDVYSHSSCIRPSKQALPPVLARSAKRFLRVGKRSCIHGTQPTALHLLHDGFFNPVAAQSFGLQQRGISGLGQA